MQADVLAGCRVVVPVTARESGLANDLAVLGADVTRVEFIAIEAPTNPGELESVALDAAAGRYAWIVFTSRNAVRGFADACDAVGVEFSQTCGEGIAAAGDTTAGACRARGVEPTLVSPGGSEALVENMPTGEGLVLAPLGNLASHTMVTGLMGKGWDVQAVEAYQTVRGPGPDQSTQERLAGGDIDAVLLTSGSVAESFAFFVPAVEPGTIIGGIGAQTAAAARAHGIALDVVAESPSRESLVAALVSEWRRRR